MEDQDEEALQKIDFEKLNFQQRIEILPFLEKYDKSYYLKLLDEGYYHKSILEFYNKTHSAYMYHSCKWIRKSLYRTCVHSCELRSTMGKRGWKSFCNCTEGRLFNSEYYLENTYLAGLNTIQTVLLLRELIRTRKNYKILRELKKQKVLHPWLFFSLFCEEDPNDPLFDDFVFHQLYPFTESFTQEDLVRSYTEGKIKVGERSYLNYLIRLRKYFPMIVGVYATMAISQNQKEAIMDGLCYETPKNESGNLSLSTPTFCDKIEWRTTIELQTPKNCLPKEIRETIVKFYDHRWLRDET